MNEYKVGLLTLASIAAMVFMSLKVTRNQAGFGEYVSYRTILDDASGIFPKTSIKVAGINSGRIKNIELSDRKALIVFEVVEKVVVPAGSVLKVKTVGMLGDKYLELVLGSSDERLSENSLVPSEASGGLGSLTSDAGEALNDLKIILKALRDAVAPEGETSPVKLILANLNQSMRNLKQLTKRLSDFIHDNEVKLTTIVENFEHFSGSLAEEFDTQNPNSLLTKTKKLGPILENARKATEDLKSIMSDLKAGRGTLGRLLRDEEVVDQVSQTLSGVQQMVNRFNSIRSELELFTNVNTDGNNRSELGLSIYPSPERFYRLGLTSTEIGVESEKIITTEQGGVEVRQTRKEVDKNTFKVNAQIGRELQRFRLRVGLFESSGGVAVDYKLREWGTRFSLEAFDYRKEFGPNLRFTTQMHIWNVIYGNLAVEDIVSKRDEQSLTIGAGLRFSDEDLRGLIGLFI